MEHKRTLVIDNGSGTIKAGISGENAPRWVFPSLVGRPRQNGDVLKEEFYFGKEAEEKRFALSVSHPIQKGVITNWDDMSKLWHHFFYKELGEEPSETPALLTQGTLLST
jgi:actin-related protein